MKTIIINGANGYVASHFILKLLEHNYKVVALVRPSFKASPRERMQQVLDKMSSNGRADTSGLRVFGYSLLHRNFSMTEADLKEIFNEEVDYFHFAASLKFDAKSKDEIFETNVGGVGNSIQVFTKYAQRRSRFFFIGTAYSCGKYAGRFEEKFYPNQDISHFRNYYEQSKRFAENVVQKHRIEQDLNGHVIRLSQVVGNNKTGVTKTDYGIFDFAKRIGSLALRNPNQKVRVHFDPASTQNLIPINTVVDYLLQTVQLEQVPVIMNFIARQQTKNIHIIKSISQLLPIDIVPEPEIARHEMSAMERIIAAGMTFTGSYTKTNLQFDTKNVDAVLNAETPGTNEKSVFRMLEYFIDNFLQQENKKAIATAI